MNTRPEDDGADDGRGPSRERQSGGRDALLDGLPSVDDHQGGYGETQARHAQSGQSRGGVDFGGREHHSQTSLGPRSYRGLGPRGHVRPDHSIADDIIERLTDDERIDASEILVGVDHGQVLLTGNVPERAMKRDAENVAAKATGVVDVENRLRVDDGAASFGPSGAAVRSGHDQTGSGFSSSARPDRL